MSDSQAESKIRPLSVAGVALMLATAVAGFLWFEASRQGKPPATLPASIDGHTSAPKNVSKFKSARAEREFRRQQLETSRKAKRRQRMLATPKAKKLRKQSRFAHVNLDAKRALKLISTEQRSALTTPAWKPPMVPKGAQVAGYTSETTARIDMPRSRADAIVESTAGPLATSNGKQFKPVDLRLERADKTWSPKNAKVEATFPADLSDRIRLALGKGLGDIEIGLGDVKSLAVPSGDEKLFYANALTDTDVIAEALPEGAAVSWTLRSVRSPESLPLQLKFPFGV
ncbi:MAG: hypothetical protein ACPHCI_04655, partial [Solirubrobacterales bacterium]